MYVSKNLSDGKQKCFWRSEGGMYFAFCKTINVSLTYYKFIVGVYLQYTSRTVKTTKNKVKKVRTIRKSGSHY